jgi:hypothetical protein
MNGALLFGNLLEMCGTCFPILNYEMHQQGMNLEITSVVRVSDLQC